MADSPSDAEQFRPKDKRRPSPGQPVYVPGRAPMFYGGLARVSESSTKRTIFVDEDPGTPYTWSSLQWQQTDLWVRHGVQRARLATHEEIRSSQESRQAEAAEQQERARIAREQEWAPRDYAVLNRGLMEVPAWNEHHRAKNWAATLEVDPVAPGGLRRRWFNRGNGPVFYVVPDSLEPGDAVEFGADRVSYSGNRDGNRWYGVVLAVSNTAIRLQKCVSAADAASKSSAMRSRAAMAAASSRVSSGQAPTPPASPEPVSA